MSTDPDVAGPDIAAEVRAAMDRVTPAKRKGDAETLLGLFARATGVEPQMWGSSIVGYGTYHYRYESGREGDSCAAGFAPRKTATVIYLADGIAAHGAALERLGPHTTGVGCLYLKDLAQNDLAVLEEIVTKSYARLAEGTYGRRAREGGEGL